MRKNKKNFEDIKNILVEIYEAVSKIIKYIEEIKRE